MRIWLAALLALIALSAVPASAAPAPAPTTTVEVQKLPPVGGATANTAPVKFDAQKATNAYLATVKGEARAKSDSYFEGGYWLILWNALYTIVVAALFLWLKISAWMRNNAARVTRSRFWQVPIYIIQFFVLLMIVTFPLSVYQDFFREHQYGLSNQNFAQWMGDQGKAFGIGLVLITIVVTLIYAAIRAAGRRWWMWGTAIMIAFGILGATVAPVYISPLFNTYTSVKPGPLKDKILSVARSEGIPAHDVYVFDASKQSKRISANVSGMFGTTRISLNDNLLHRSTPQEVIAVLGHEMGHYVLNHGLLGIVAGAIEFLFAFAFVAWGFGALARTFGDSWDVRTVDDPAGVPVLLALFTFFFFILTPLDNSISRFFESQADIFGVNAVRQPDAFAQAALQLSEYRKLDPSPLEEAIFYDHPSGRSRIHMMMVWKAEHLNDPDIKAGPVSPQ